MKLFAIISVWDKTGIAELASSLIEAGYHIISTGGTYTKIREVLSEDQRASLSEVEDITGYPSLLGGRVKTLHPAVHAGILARNDQLHELEKRGISKISLVVVNLYPFKDTVATGADEATVLENIDIGGHTLLRAAAKNYTNTLVVTDPADYSQVLSITDVQDRRRFASKAFSHAAEYDIAIAQYFGDQTVRKYYPQRQLKYGCNPHQGSAALCGINTDRVPFTVLNGNIGYINIIDALLGFQLVTEADSILGAPAAASYKHTSPAGVGLGNTQLADAEKVAFGVLSGEVSYTAIAFIRARNCDPLSSFGDFIAISRTVDVSTAEQIKKEVSDGIVAPGYTEEALAILKTKKNGQFTILQLDPEWSTRHSIEYREIGGFALCQEPNRAGTTTADLTNIPTVLKDIPIPRQQDLILANITLKYTQSNSVAYAYAGQVIGIGAGQQNRVDCVKLAGQKAQRWCARFRGVALQKKLELTGTRSEQNNVLYEFLDTQEWPRTELPLSLASDAFFPFPDSIKVADGFGVKYILQPGNSVGDTACIKECDERGIVMAMSNKRMFLH